MNAISHPPMLLRPRRVSVELSRWELDFLIGALEMRAGELASRETRDMAELLFERAAELREASMAG